MLIADPRTRAAITNAFFGEALTLGTDASVLQVPMPSALQTSIGQSPTVTSRPSAAQRTARCSIHARRVDVGAPVAPPNALG